MTAGGMSPDPLWTREFLGFSCALVPDTRWLDKAGGKRKIHVMARMQGEILRLTSGFLFSRKLDCC